MNKENCARADRCKFGKNCEREYNPRADWLCFNTRVYSRYDAALAKRAAKNAKGSG